MIQLQLTRIAPVQSNTRASSHTRDCPLCSNIRTLHVPLRSLKTACTAYWINHSRIYTLLTRRGFRKDPPTSSATMMARIPQIKQFVSYFTSTARSAQMATPQRLPVGIKKYLPPLPGMPGTPHVPRHHGAGQVDYPEVFLLYGWLCFAAGIGVYTLKDVLLSNKDGAYLSVDLRGDYEHQAEKGWEDYMKQKGHTMWWRVAQVKMDEDGANIGVLWDNRTRPHQYSKPGMQGMGAGIPSA